MVTLQLHTQIWDVAVLDVADVPAFAVGETNQTGPPKPRLLDRVREALRTRHDGHRTETAYVAWIRRYIFFHGTRHPSEMGPAEINRGPGECGVPPTGCWRHDRRESSA